MRTIIGVLAEAPVSGECKQELLAAYGADWVTGLYAAMLRDVLDGAQAITADAYVVLSAPKPTAEAAIEVLVRHVPAPWTILAQPVLDRAARIEHGLDSLARGYEGERVRVVLLSADVPSFPAESLSEAVDGCEHEEGLVLAPTENGDCWVIASHGVDARAISALPWGTPAVLHVARASCAPAGIALRQGPPWYAVDAPSDVLRLQEELRKHPERAPRTAQYLLTHV